MVVVHLAHGLALDDGGFLLLLLRDVVGVVHAHHPIVETLLAVARRAVARRVSRDILALHGSAEGAHLPLARRAPLRRLDAEAHLAEGHLEPRELHERRLGGPRVLADGRHRAETAPLLEPRGLASRRADVRAKHQDAVRLRDVVVFAGEPNDARAPCIERHAALGVFREVPVRHHGLLRRARARALRLPRRRETHQHLVRRVHVRDADAHHALDEETRGARDAARPRLRNPKPVRHPGEHDDGGDELIERERVFRDGFLRPPREPIQLRRREVADELGGNFGLFVHEESHRARDVGGALSGVEDARDGRVGIADARRAGELAGDVHLAAHAHELRLGHEELRRDLFGNTDAARECSLLLRRREAGVRLEARLEKRKVPPDFVVHEPRVLQLFLHEHILDGEHLLALERRGVVDQLLALAVVVPKNHALKLDAASLARGATQIRHDVLRLELDARAAADFASHSFARLDLLRVGDGVHDGVRVVVHDRARVRPLAQLRQVVPENQRGRRATVAAALALQRDVRAPLDVRRRQRDGLAHGAPLVHDVYLLGRQREHLGHAAARPVVVEALLAGVPHLLVHATAHLFARVRQRNDNLDLLAGDVAGAAADAVLALDELRAHLRVGHDVAVRAHLAGHVQVDAAGMPHARLLANHALTLDHLAASLAALLALRRGQARVFGVRLILRFLRHENLVGRDFVVVVSLGILEVPGEHGAALDVFRALRVVRELLQVLLGLLGVVVLVPLAVQVVEEALVAQKVHAPLVVARVPDVRLKLQVDDVVARRLGAAREPSARLGVDAQRNLAGGLADVDVVQVSEETPTGGLCRKLRREAAAGLGGSAARQRRALAQTGFRVPAGTAPQAPPGFLRRLRNRARARSVRRFRRLELEHVAHLERLRHRAGLVITRQPAFARAEAQRQAGPSRAVARRGREFVEKGVERVVVVEAVALAPQPPLEEGVQGILGGELLLHALVELAVRHLHHAKQALLRERHHQAVVLGVLQRRRRQHRRANLRLKQVAVRRDAAEVPPLKPLVDQPVAQE